MRESGRIVSVAAIIAVAVNTEGKREIVGLHIGPSEAEVFWSDFLKDLDYDADLPGISGGFLGNLPGDRYDVDVVLADSHIVVTEF